MASLNQNVYTMCSRSHMLVYMIVYFCLWSVSSAADDGVPGYLKSACADTRFPERCHATMSEYYTKQTATNDNNGDNMVMSAMRASIEHAASAHTMAEALPSHYKLDPSEVAAWQDCVELFEDAMSNLNACMSENKPSGLYMSAALTHFDTCLNGFRDLNCRKSPFRSMLWSAAVNVSELVSNSLSMYKRRQLNVAARKNKKRRLLASSSSSSSSYDDSTEDNWVDAEGFPRWMSKGDRRLLQSSSAVKANVVVAQDGSGNFKTITEAVNGAPQKSGTRYVIYIKAGTYKENVEITGKMTNIMLIGDGKDRTVLTGSRNVQDGTTTFKSATVAVSGNGFMARDMTFENTAGPAKHQAVALRVGSDKAVIYRCSMKGYQDTLYVYSLRQFYREIDVYGTVDFIFGNAAAVIQNSNIFVRNPMSGQFNTITAQGRGDPNENTGIVLQNCHIAADANLQSLVKTYLGRPWRQYSRTIVMGSTLDSLINPAGWTPWDGNFALDTLYYAEYNNKGAGASTSRRVTWKGFHIIDASTAAQFTVSQFIVGDSWISDVPFTAGL